MTVASEFERLIKIDRLPSEPVVLTATEAERAALAERFDLSAIRELEATVTLDDTGVTIVADGRLHADIQQLCAITREPFAVQIDEPVELRFMRIDIASKGVEKGIDSVEQEVELADEDLDIIDYEGESFDLGEAIAQTLGLAIDPYAEGPDADAARKKAGITSDEEQAPSGPLAEALAALKKD